MRKQADRKKTPRPRGGGGVKAPPAVPRAAVNWSTPTPRDLSGCFCSGQGSEEYRARSAVLKLATTRDGAYCEHLGFTPQVTEVFLCLNPGGLYIRGCRYQRRICFPQRHGCRSTWRLPDHGFNAPLSCRIEIKQFSHRLAHSTIAPRGAS